MDFSSFYGGKQGASFVIKKTYASVDAMEAEFARGDASTNEVNYGEYVVISSPSIENDNNGKVFRRGYSGEEYIGQFRGPKGAKGETGDTGPQGPKGDTGNGLYLGFEVDSVDELYNGTVEPGNGIPPETKTGDPNKAGYCAIVATYESSGHGYSTTITNAVFGYDYIGQKQDYLPNTGIVGNIPAENISGTFNQNVYLPYEQITGQIPVGELDQNNGYENIANIPASSITGHIPVGELDQNSGYENIANIPAGSITGQIPSSQISGDWSASNISGVISIANGGTGNSEGTIPANKITGIVPIIHGGTGNDKGYIQTGNGSGYFVGLNTTIEGENNRCLSENAHIEGYHNDINNDSSSSAHAEGSNNIIGTYSPFAQAALLRNTASNDSAEVYSGKNIASGYYSHAEGGNSTASGYYSHVEGGSNTASGYFSHASGFHTTASGRASHTSGYYTVADGYFSFATGSNTTAAQNYQTVIGKYNDNKTDTLFEVGNGTGYYGGDSNAFEVYSDGSISMDNGASRLQILKNSNDDWGFYPDGDTENFVKFGDNIPNPLPIDMGGTGNQVGYIQTGKASGHTPNSTATVEGTNNIGLTSNAHAEGDHTIAGGQKEKEIVYDYTESTSQQGQSSSSYTTLTFTDTNTKRVKLFEIQHNIPSNYEDYFLYESVIGTNFPSITLDIPQEGFVITNSFTIPGSSIQKQCEFGYNPISTLINLSDPFAQDISIRQEDSSTSTQVVSLFSLINIAYQVRRTRNNNYDTLEVFLSMNINPDQADVLERLLNGGQNGIIRITTTGSSRQSANLTSCYYEKRTTELQDVVNTHAEGSYTQAISNNTHANGYYTTAGYDYQTVVGKYNDNKSGTLFEVGNGTATNAKSNALEIYSNGNAVIGGTLTTGGTTLQNITPCSIRFCKDANDNYGYIKKVAGADTFVPFKSSDYEGTLLQENGVDETIESISSGDKTLTVINDLIKIVPNGTPTQYTTVQVYCKYNYFKIVNKNGLEIILSFGEQGAVYETPSQLSVDFLNSNTNLTGEGFIYISSNNSTFMARRYKLQYKYLDDGFTTTGGYFRIISFMTSAVPPYTTYFIPQYIYGLDENPDF